jgi:adenylate kinase
MYNVHFSPPKKEGVCDKCGRELYQRADDKEDTIKNRLDIYEKSTAPLIDYYGKKSILKFVKGEGSIEDIFNSICSILQAK